MERERIIPSLTLTEVVNEYMMASFNERRKYFLNYLSVARRVWKELYWGTLNQVVSRYVAVDKSTTAYSIPYPADCVRLLNVFEVDDCNNLQSLSVDNFMNVLEQPKAKNTSCQKHKKCGCEDSLCDAIDSMTVVLKDVWIDGVPYVEKIWHKRFDNGDLMEIRETHVKSFSVDANGKNAGNTIIPDVQRKLICRFDVNDCGCVLPTDKNKKLVVSHCGCLLPVYIEKVCNTVLPRTKNEYGHYKVEGGRIYIDTEKDWVIETHQTNGECDGDEILIEEVAVIAMMFGIDFMTKAFRPNIPAFEKRESKLAYNQAKTDLLHFKNPIRIDEFMKISDSIPKW